jgi:hypothetical protein
MWIDEPSTTIQEPANAAGRGRPPVLIIFLFGATIASSLVLTFQAAGTLAQYDILLSLMEIVGQAIIHVTAAAVVPAFWWATRRFRMDRLFGPSLLWLALTIGLGLSMIIAVDYL